MLDVVKKQETLTTTKYEKVNLGKEKKIATAQKVKYAQIALLKNQYKHSKIELMEYLSKISQYAKNYD